MRIKIYITFVFLMILMGVRFCIHGEIEKREVRVGHFSSFSRTFNDLNPVHLHAAREWGVERVYSREDAEDNELQKIESCDDYQVAKLTHSIPYLVPRAAELLEQIGENFQDSLESKGVGGYQIRVTSVLRSVQDVKKLRRVNVNASANSAHCYGTTFDISWSKYNRISSRYPHEIPMQKLKLVLAEVLRDLKKQGACYVKYEARQACFHITTR